MGFSKLCGNEAVKKSLIRAVRQNRISNSYVFEGISGVGKRFCAEIFAGTLVCADENAPCGVCQGCTMAKNNIHPDIIHIEHDEDKASIGVDNIRENIIKEAYIKPYYAKRKVFIIGDGDALSIEAQNAFLKVLEEPPENVTFIICVTKQDKLLDTVLSRSLVLSFFPLSYNEVYNYLIENYGESEHTSLIARLSQGSIGTAVSMLSDENITALFEESINQITMLKNEPAKVREVADFLIKEKESIEKVIDFMLTYIRDCVFVKEGICEKVVYENKLSNMRVFCGNLSKKSLVLAFDRLIEFKVRLTQNLNYDASALETVMRIWEDFHDKSSGHKI